MNDKRFWWVDVVKQILSPVENEGWKEGLICGVDLCAWEEDAVWEGREKTVTIEAEWIKNFSLFFTSIVYIQREFLIGDGGWNWGRRSFFFLCFWDFLLFYFYVRERNMMYMDGECLHGQYFVGGKDGHVSASLWREKKILVWFFLN